MVNHSGIVIDSPATGHKWAYTNAWHEVAMAQRKRMSKLTKEPQLACVSFVPLKMTKADQRLFCESVGRWYRAFGILSAYQWMPEGYEWRKVRGEWRPMAVKAAA
jgi:hypothetical protein